MEGSATGADDTGCVGCGGTGVGGCAWACGCVAIGGVDAGGCTGGGSGSRRAGRIDGRTHRQQRLRVDVALLLGGHPDAEIDVRLGFFWLSTRPTVATAASLTASPFLTEIVPRC